MLRETGTVVKARHGTVSVRLPRTTRCEGCSGCALSGGGFYMLADAEDPIGVSVGDQVVIEGKEPGQIGGGLIVYILPLALFVVGFVAASSTASSLGGPAAEGAGVAGGLLLIALYFVSVALYNRRLAGKRRAVMRVERVLRRSGADAGVSQPEAGQLKDDWRRGGRPDQGMEVKRNG